MNFLVSRVSNREDMPHPLAVLKPYIYVDERDVDDPHDINWYKEGTNHRVENGYIKRDLQRNDWFITIDTMEKLKDFIKSEGDIILHEGSGDFMKLTIYDNYIE
jgi:hypothetical protein